MYVEIRVISSDVLDRMKQFLKFLHLWQGQEDGCEGKDDPSVCLDSGAGSTQFSLCSKTSSQMYNSRRMLKLHGVHVSEAFPISNRIHWFSERE